MWLSTINKLKLNSLTNVPTVGTFRKRPILCNAPLGKVIDFLPYLSLQFDLKQYLLICTWFRYSISECNLKRAQQRGDRPHPQPPCSLSFRQRDRERGRTVEGSLLSLSFERRPLHPSFLPPFLRSSRAICYSAADHCLLSSRRLTRAASAFHKSPTQHRAEQTPDK